MLSFATEFPVDRKHSSTEVLAAIRDWILKSPHTDFVLDDFKSFVEAPDWTQKKRNQSVHKISSTSNDESSVGVRVVLISEGIEWDTTIVHSLQSADAWVSVRTSRESIRPTTRLPPAKKPIVVRKLLQSLGHAPDGLLTVSQKPTFIRSGDIDLAARLIMGVAGCRLPVVYVSSGFGGEPLIDSRALADDLSGMAHVVVEPNRPFSRRLQIEVDSENVYGGAVGIYWPGGAARRSFFLGRGYESSAEISRAIADEVRVALMNRRPLVRCTWAAVQESASKETVKLLKSSGSIELVKYIEAFDTELNAKAQQLIDAEAEIARLGAEVRKYEARTSLGSGLELRTGAERDFYADELLEMVRDALEESLNRVQSDSRREHVLKSILKATATSGGAAKRRESLKDILREYKNMDRKVRKALEDIGFSVDEEGKHYKLTFQGDDRYTFSLSKTGGDHRGGLNAASDISKRVF